jgi:hypothetical protein
VSAGLYGVVAQFGSPEALLAAIRALRRKGVAGLEAYAPYPIEGLSESLGLQRNCVPLATLIGGAVGGLGGFFMQWYASVVSFPINIGGRPLNSWPLFIPVSFELTILCAALAAVLSMLIANGLPRLNHPIFDTPGFNLASRDRYFLCVRAMGKEFNSAHTQELLNTLEPVAVIEVPQ